MVVWLVAFYGISTLVDYLMPIPVYTYVADEDENEFKKSYQQICCGLQIRPVEEQLKQRVIGELYCINRKRSHTKELLAVLGLSNVS